MSIIFGLCLLFVTQTPRTLVISRLIGVKVVQYLVLVSGSLNKIIQDLEISRVVSFFMLMIRLVAGVSKRASGWGLVSRGTCLAIEELELSAPLPPLCSRDGREAGN